MSYITSLARNRGTQEVARNTVKARAHSIAFEDYKLVTYFFSG
jgi:hypothetical protein